MRFVFAVPIAGSVIAMMLSTLVYVFALLSLGLLVATKAENQMQALQMSMVFICRASSFPVSFSRAKRCRGFSTRSARSSRPPISSHLMRAIILRGASFLEYWPIARHHDR